MTHPDQAVVTGAFSYAGRYVARRLLGDGVRVRTLTRNPDREDPFAGRVKAYPMDFSDPEGLRRSMEGAGVLYNTYWIRYARGGITFHQAVRNTGTLFQAAVAAGVGRIVHFSVANPSNEYDLPYFRGKAQVEEMLKAVGISYATIRPTLVFGKGDLLLNNMAWALRRFPVFPVFGRGDYLVQPIYAGDLAALAVESGSRADSFVANAGGPDTFTFEELLRLLASAVGARVRLVHTPPFLGFALTKLVGLLLRDVGLTRDEVDGLMAGLLKSGARSTGTTRLGDWLADNGSVLGQRYVSESRRNLPS
ncbi:MAG: NAD(P)H-binding protein [Chloroflexi bacterium]|nr:NAD(P)H-binding protein [Chloroflexota bacterium]MYE39587.1 NAD(P)H-binding protein [Chloroflexota bacterium]